jgi:hypothetical protein
VKGLRIALALLAAAIVPACGGGSSSAPDFPEHEGSTPAAPTVVTGYDGAVVYDTPGAFKILSRGGTGSAGAGGNGGGIRIHNLSGSEGQVLKTGSVDASIAIPETLPVLGPNPRTISTDTELSVVAGLFAGQTFILGDDGVTNATGLHVLPGVVLTLHANWDSFNQDLDNDPATGNKELCNLSFPQAVIIEGTVETVDKEAYATWKSDLQLGGDGTVLIRENGKISTRGENAATGFGGTAGFIILFSSGSVVNRGTLDASGGTGEIGGWGSQIILQSAFWAVYNSGPLRTAGGDGTNGAGGGGAQITITASAAAGSFTGGGVLNSGDLTSRGGNGTTGGGPGGNIISTSNDSDGPFFSSGVLDSSGGRAWLSGNGGNAGQIVVRARGGEARVSGALYARGGAGAGTGNGGNGNFMQISADNIGGQPVGAGCFVGADLDASGGNGAVGGNAALIEVWNNATFGGPHLQPGRQPCILTGYLILDASGGSGTTAGGAAAGVELNNYAANDGGGTPHLRSFLNEADLAARGGNASAGPGGAGSSVFFGARNNYASTNTTDVDRQLVNRGAVIVHGGNGVTGGAGGTFTMNDPFYVRNEGAVTTSGGSGTTGPGGAANNSILYSDGLTLNTGALTANGGPSGSGTGGAGGQATIQGAASSQSGTMSARGGNSTTGTGGGGGRLRIISFNGATPSTISGFLDVRGGAGAAVGVEGTILIEGIFQALDGGTLTF